MDEYELDAQVRMLESYKSVIRAFDRVVRRYYRDAAWRKAFGIPAEFALLKLDIGCRITELRTKRGLTAIQLSTRSKLTLRQLTRIVGGKDLLSADTEARIAKALAVDVKELWERPENLTRPRRGRPCKC